MSDHGPLPPSLHTAQMLEAHRTRHATLPGTSRGAPFRHTAPSIGTYLNAPRSKVK